MKRITLLVVLCLSTSVTAYQSAQRIPAFHPPDFSAHPNARARRNDEPRWADRCVETWRNATLDHFSWGLDGGFAKFDQRYFVCDEFWNSAADEKGPIFLYLGNESPVEKCTTSIDSIASLISSHSRYIEATGLMWELAPEFGALLVFIEHRYYGKSKPFESEFREHLDYLSAEQAIADFAEFLFEFQSSFGETNLPVIGFGGSYGGMLGAWMRLKYPHLLHGVIASSAPIWSFMGEVPPVDPNYFDKIKTYTASYLAKAEKECVPNIKRTWVTLFDVASSGTAGSGMEAVRRALNICPDVELELTTNTIWKIIYWIDHAITIMAEGSYGFPSDYMTDGVAKLPPYPLRLGCTYLAEPLNDVELLEGVGKMIAIYYNVTKDAKCFQLEREISEEGKEISDLWSHQYCTEMFQMFGSDGESDMFWFDPWNPEGTKEYCKRHHNTEARPYWATIQWGGKDISYASNIIFSNGEYDPWRGGGVETNISDTAVAILILEGGHHADLMFSTDQDNESLRSARQFEKESIAVWVEEVREKNRKLKELLVALSPESPSATGSIAAIENLDTFQDTKKRTDGLLTLGPRLNADDSSLRSAFIEGDLDTLEQQNVRFIV